MGSFIIWCAIFIGLSRIKIRWKQKKIETNITWLAVRWWHDGLWFPTTANRTLCSHMTMIESGSWPLGTVKIIIILLLLLCCFISTETVQTFRDVEPRTSTSFFFFYTASSSSSSVLLYVHWDSTLSGTQSPEHAPLFFTQLLLLLQCCFMSTETRHFQGHRVQNMHPFFSHSFFFFFSVASRPQRRYRLSGTQSPEHPLILSCSSWTLNHPTDCFAACLLGPCASMPQSSRLFSYQCVGMGFKLLPLWPFFRHPCQARGPAGCVGCHPWLLRAQVERSSCECSVWGVSLCLSVHCTPWASVLRVSQSMLMQMHLLCNECVKPQRHSWRIACDKNSVSLL